MKHDTPTSSQPSSLVGQFGWAVLIGFLSLLAIALTILVPPWLEVPCLRRQALWWSERVEVLDTSFAGFDFFWAKWNIPPGHAANELFEWTDFDIYWHVLFAEWAVIIALACVCYFKLSITVFRILRSIDPIRTEQSQPAIGPDSNGKSPPPPH